MEKKADFDAETALDFLQTIFAGCPEEEWVSVWAVDRYEEAGFKPDKVLWAPVGDLERLVKQVRSIAGTHCVWFGVATRKEHLKGQRGGREDCSHLPALFADIDLEGPSHKAQGYPPDRHAVDAILSEFPEPSIMVYTGGGYHAYWVYPTPVPMPRAAINLSRFGTELQNASVRAGYKLDSVFNVDRVLRLPGTFNRKPALGEVIPVSIVATHMEE